MHAHCCNRISQKISDAVRETWSDLGSFSNSFNFKLFLQIGCIRQLNDDQKGTLLQNVIEN